MCGGVYPDSFFLISAYRSRKPFFPLVTMPDQSKARYWEKCVPKRQALTWCSGRRRRDDDDDWVNKWIMCSGSICLPYNDESIHFEDNHTSRGVRTWREDISKRTTQTSKLFRPNAFQLDRWRGECDKNVVGGSAVKWCKWLSWIQDAWTVFALPLPFVFFVCTTPARCGNSWLRVCVLWRTRLAKLANALKYLFWLFISC